MCFWMIPVCLNVGHQESKLHMAFMVDKDSFTMFFSSLLCTLQPLQSNPYDMAADNISSMDYS